MDKVKDQAKKPKLITTQNKAPQFDCIANDKAKDVITIRILEGKFQGTEFHFGVLKFEDDLDDEGFARMSFDYTMLNNIEHSGTTEFEEVVAAILYRIIDMYLEMTKEKKET